MKTEGLDHPKTLRLCEVLKERRATVIGYMELLWNFTAKYAIEGDVGKWSDERIGEYCCLSRSLEPERFINALVEVGFLDRCPKHRLLIHDWKDHCPAWVSAKMKRENRRFARRHVETAVGSESLQPADRDDDIYDKEQRIADLRRALRVDPETPALPY